MSAKILDGKILAAKLKEQLKHNIDTIVKAKGRSIAVASIIVGKDPAGHSYALSQQKTAQSLGIDYQLHELSDNVSLDNILTLIAQLNRDSNVHGIMINKPLPPHIDFTVLINALLPEKDIEGMSLNNLGRLFIGKSRLIPCTAAAAMAHLYALKIDLKGKEAVVIGRSDIVGKPLALLLLQAHITTTICHSATSKAGRLDEHIKRADILIAAIGQPLFVKGDWIKPGAIVIDVGINHVNGQLVGDVDYNTVKEKAGFITPVPGGVGPVTSVMLMQNAFEAYQCQQ